jgi:hypothetical protein
LGAAKPPQDFSSCTFSLSISLSISSAVCVPPSSCGEGAPRLRRQLEDSLSRIAQNLCEGSGRFGGDGPHLYRCALGSLREVNGILLAAVAFGRLHEAPKAPERDRLGAILYKLQRG